MRNWHSCSYQLRIYHEQTTSVSALFTLVVYFCTFFYYKAIKLTCFKSFKTIKLKVFLYFCGNLKLDVHQHKHLN